MSGLFIAVEGPTGAGKTTLAGRLAAALGADLVLDPFEDNSFLAQLLAADRPDEVMALRVELTFFALRVAQLRQIADLLTAGRRVVADWALLKQPIFAATTLDAASAARVAATVRVWEASLPRPDVIIGLSAPTPVLCERIRRRNRSMEAGVTFAALDVLAVAFEAAYAAWAGLLVRVDAATFDPFNDDQVHELAARL